MIPQEAYLFPLKHHDSSRTTYSTWRWDKILNTSCGDFLLNTEYTFLVRSLEQMGKEDSKVSAKNFWFIHCYHTLLNQSLLLYAFRRTPVFNFVNITLFCRSHISHKLSNFHYCPHVLHTQLIKQICIREVCSLNLSRYCSFLWFSSVPSVNARIVPSLGYICFIPKPLWFITHQSRFHFMLHVQSKTLKVS